MAAGGVAARRPFAAIDWAAPWLAPWRALGEPLAQRLRLGEEPVHAVVQTAASRAGLPVTFVAQAELPEGAAYEQFIFQSARVPTRDHLHDFFNALVWIHFPQTKQRLNELQTQAIAANGIRAVRGPLRDAITVFDENGALLQAPDPLWQALRARDWKRLFVDLRPLWRDARLVLFGHALLEKLVSPRKPIAAHVHWAPAAIETIAELDVWLAGAVEPEAWATRPRPFAPMPVLGVPLWWPANADPDFYADAQVFRPPRCVAPHGGAQIPTASGC